MNFLPILSIFLDQVLSISFGLKPFQLQSQPRVFKRDLKLRTAPRLLSGSRPPAVTQLQQRRKLVSRLHAVPTETHPKNAVRRGIVTPDIQTILDVIIRGCDDLDKGIADIVNTSLITISNTVGATTEKEKIVIAPVIDAGNKDIETGLTTILNDASADMDAIMNEITQKEISSTTDVLQQKNTTLTKAISDLITTLNNNIVKLADTSGTSQADALKALIQSENQSLYDQIQTILSDPNNNDPIIPQLKFPDPVAMAGSIEPGMQQLYSDIKALFDKFITDIKSLITDVQAYETGGTTTIMDEGTKELISRLEGAVGNVLVLVQALLDKVSAKETSDITTALSELHTQMTTDITDEVQSIATKSAELITNVTTNELVEMSTVIAKYNQDIAQGILTNLST